MTSAKLDKNASSALAFLSDDCAQQASPAQVSAAQASAALVSSSVRASADALNSAAEFSQRLSAEQRRSIAQWNATEHLWPDDPCLHELVEAQVQRTPDAPAVIWDEQVVTYAQLNNRAHRVAAALLAAGAVSQEPIGLVADCTPEAIIGLLGILKAGCAYLPLDATLPDERWRYFLQDAKVRFVVGKTSTRDWLQPAGLTVINAQCLPQAESVCLPPVQASQLAYVLYTSGSTGKAKGVMLDHRGPVNTVRDINQRFAIQSSDRVLALSSLGFDLSVYDLFGTLSAGGAIVQPTLAQARDPQQWSRLIQQHHVSVWNTVPALMDMLVTFNSDRQEFPSLRWVMLSGDWIPLSLPDRIRAMASQARQVALGGSTEASIWSVIYPFDQVDSQWRSIPYGYPMLNQRCYVIDDELRLSPIGEVGELCLAGVGVAQGYINRSELSAERFLNDPLKPGSRLYRTGDLCRYLPDGSLEFLGRRDHQIKIRGFRIGLGEIESEIGRLPMVREVAVVASEEATGARLIAYVALKSDATLTLEALNDHLRQSLPEYMLPSALVQLSTLPLSPNGKIDRRQLPLPAIERPAPLRQLPTTQTEVLIHDLLCRLLRLDQIDTSDDFYALGGNSLSAVALISKIREACGVELSVPELLCNSFNTQTLAARIDSWLTSGQGSIAVRTWPAIDGDPLSRAPLSYAQQQMWVVNFLEKERQRYVVPLVYEIQTASDDALEQPGKPLDTRALQFALDALVQRHDILRTVYLPSGWSLEQIVLPTGSPELRIVDLRDVPSQERARRFHDDALGLVTAPFDLQHEFPIRAALYQLSEVSWQLVIAVHHIAIDGISVNLLQRELADHYRAYVSGRTIAAQPLAHQYANYAQWQQVAMPPASFESDRAYWRDQLQGPLPVLNLAEDRGQSTEAEGRTFHFQIDSSLLSSLNQFSKENRTTQFIALLAVIKALLYRYTGQTDIVLGTTLSTREEVVSPELIGYFINVLPLRTQFSADDDFVQLLGRVRETVLGALAHRHYPLELLKREILFGEAAGQDPFRVVFVLEDEPQALTLPGVKCTTLPFDTQTTKFDLLIAAFVSEEKIRFELQYRCECFDPRRIEQFSHHLRALLAAVIDAPHCPLNEVDWLPGSERAILSSSPAGTSTGTSTIVSPSFMQRFSNQVQQSPAAIAVGMHHDQLSYAELDTRSSQLARLIKQQLDQAKSTRTELVAIHLPRSLDMIVGVLAVLKAGAAYVPIDPAWPIGRREQVLNDCRPRLVLSHSHLDALVAASGEPLPRLDCDQLDLQVVDPSIIDPSTIDPSTIDSERLAYLLYTSGSTGRPKGVAMGRGALDNLIAWQVDHSRAGLRTRTLQFASLGFDVSFQEIFATLCTGGELVLIDESLQGDLNRLWKFIVAEQVERLLVPFVALRGLCEIAGQNARQSALREIITAGEQLQITPVIREFFQQLPNCRLWNHYGPTETHVVTAYQLPADSQLWCSQPPIGHPLNNCEIAILDKNRQPVPRGAHGELYLGGQCLAAGYYNNPALTAERFIDLEVAGSRARRWYRTGDLGWLDWDGRVQFLGRYDHQVKVRGHRVELAEIELALVESSGVRQAGVRQAIVCLHSSGPTSQLRAYLLSDGRPLDLDMIKSDLAARLPAYMVPQQFCVLTEFPLTATGKVDRQRLSNMASEAIVKSPENIERTAERDDPIIERLKSIWQSVLSVERLHADSNFFECGGDSLAAAILFARLEEQFEQRISISTLVERPTLRKLAEVYRRPDPAITRGWNKLAPLQPHGTQRPIICLPGIDGHFLNFRHMIGLLGSDRPWLGLQPVGLDGVQQPLSEIGEMAADHVRTLREAIPNGPYNLVGFSFGGIVAYEMSQLLRKSGQQVGLALIDCSTGACLQPTPLQSLVFHCRYAAQLPHGRRLTYWWQRVHGLWLGMQFKMRWINWEQRLAGLIDVQGSYAHVAAMNMQSLMRYSPGPALGPAVLYRAQLRANWPGRDRTDPAASWWPLFRESDLEVVDIEGAHGNILNRPNVDRLVDHLRGVIL